MTAIPVALDDSLRLAPVSTFLTVTSACGIAPPDGSVTLTVSAASCCAQRRIAGSKTNTVKARTVRIILGFTVPASHDGRRGGSNTPPTPSTGAHQLRDGENSEVKSYRGQYFKSTTDNA